MSRIEQASSCDRGVGRPREFDMDEALDKAMGAFWLNGYEATSLCDLMEATGLQKGSIYKAFGDKHSLFVRALRRYLDIGFERVSNALGSASTATEAIERWLEMSVGVCSDSKRGCFAVNAAIELAPHDTQVRRILDRHFRRVNGALADAIERGQASGEFRTDVDPCDGAEFLSVFVSGLAASSKTTPRARGTDQFDRLARHALRTLSV